MLRALALCQNDSIIYFLTVAISSLSIQLIKLNLCMSLLQRCNTPVSVETNPFNFYALLQLGGLFTDQLIVINSKSMIFLTERA